MQGLGTLLFWPSLFRLEAIASRFLLLGAKGIATRNQNATRSILT